MHLVLASTLVVATVLQSTYVPDRLGQCKAFENPSRQGVVPNLFKVIASAEAASTPQSKCRELVWIWSTEITLM